MNYPTLCAALCLALIGAVSGAGLREEFTWSRITYRWPGVGGVAAASRAKRYAGSLVVEDPTLVPSEQIGGRFDDADGAPEGIDYNHVNNIPMGANVWRNKLFITVPRRRLGVPSTLNYVPLDSRQKHNVPLIPYPNWEVNTYPDPTNSGENLVSLYRVAVDPCDRLWFVDTGLVEVLSANVSRIRPATIGIIDLHTDRIVHSFHIPSDQIRPTSGLASITIDVTKNTCDDAYAYVPDLGGYGLIVYSLRENRSWRISHNYFYLEPLAGEFHISGHDFQWNDGVFSVELTSLRSDGYRDLYFHSMAGTHMYKVSTRILRNETLATRSYHEHDFEVIGDRGAESQTSSADIHQPTGVMFLSLVNQNAMACWNTHKPLQTISIVQKDDRRMIYPCDLKVSGDKVYLLTNTMPEFLYGRLDYDATNFRVWSNDVASAVAGTACSGRGSTRPAGHRPGSSGYASESNGDQSYAASRPRPYRGSRTYRRIYE
ncbi:unnamed protein product [Phyllotreta striolata]|uniref:Yellow-like protein n=1 Tax=Phyllotreta striolata TaxID=444603 RepID=A0A9P0DQP0_PHYSR|nr:unnamed protein product [Phyllotreta striolata]